MCTDSIRVKLVISPLQFVRTTCVGKIIVIQNIVSTIHCVRLYVVDVMNLLKIKEINCKMCAFILLYEP